MTGMDYAKDVAAEVRGIAARKQITGMQLAAAVGVSQQSMSRRMTGALPFDVAELADVASALGVDIKQLLPDGAQVTGEELTRDDLDLAA